MNKDRNGIIIRTSVIGIVANVLLASFKAFVGIVSNSTAILIDAVNNFSDALSSLITIVGTVLSRKEPDKKHPFGHGRVEYISASIISIIVLYAGISALIRSIQEILNPSVPDYTTVGLIIVASAVIVKLLLGTYVKKTGEKVSSQALIASGNDARFDAFISSTTLIAALIFIAFKVSLESYLAAIISVFIIKAGYEMLKDTIDDILGGRIDSRISKNVKECINSFEEVYGTYDLIIHNYGPEKLVGSAHIEISDSLQASEIDELERNIANKVFKDCGVIMAGISIYAVNNTNKEAVLAGREIRTIMEEYPSIIEMHGFFLKDNMIKFDIVIDFDEKKRDEIYAEFCQKVKEKLPNYEINIVLDSDISD